MELHTLTAKPPKKADFIKRKPGRPTAESEINIEHLCDVAVNIFAEKGIYRNDDDRDYQTCRGSSVLDSLLLRE